MDKRSKFIERINDDWSKFYDNEKQRQYYYNKSTKKSQWTAPELLDDKLFRQCKICRGWGKNLVNDQLLCRRCEKKSQTSTTPMEQIQNQLSIPKAIFDKLGPCDKCKGYGRNLVCQFGFCQRCLRQQSYSSLQRLWYSILEIQSKSTMPTPNLTNQNNRIEALEQMLKDYSQIQRKNEPEAVQVEFKLGSKRASKRTQSSNYREAVDPLQMGDGESMCKAADETAEGALFQMRPLPNPSQVLRAMAKKRRMN